jgi:glycosyltransferase involved in cell wall biosynthesis
MAKTKISALIHTCDNEGSLGRALDSLRPCDEVIVVDHGSRDETVKVAKEHGAKVINAVPGVSNGAYAQNTRNQWVLCLLPHEAIAEDLEASLLEWSDAEHDPNQMGFKHGHPRAEWRRMETGGCGDAPGESQADQLDRRPAAGESQIAGAGGTYFADAG